MLTGIEPISAEQQSAVLTVERKHLIFRTLSKNLGVPAQISRHSQELKNKRMMYMAFPFGKEDVRSRFRKLTSENSEAGTHSEGLVLWDLLVTVKGFEPLISAVKGR